MDIQDDQCLECGSQLVGKLATHHLYDFLDLAVDDVTVSLHFAFAHVIEDLFDSFCPVNLVDSKNDLTGPFCNPLASFVVVVILDRVEGEDLEGLSHDFFDFEHPLFDIAFLITFIDINLTAKLDNLRLGGDHRCDLLLVAKADFLDTFEALVHMLLNERWVLGLSQNHEQVFVREEIESREHETLFFEILVERSQDSFELLVGSDKLSLERLTLSQVKDTWLSLDLVHDHLPQFVNVLESSELSSQSLADILGTEDGFEVHPLLLTLIYLYDYVLH